VARKKKRERKNEVGRKERRERKKREREREDGEGNKGGVEVSGRIDLAAGVRVKETEAVKQAGCGGWCLRCGRVLGRVRM